jgi:hypothetical protein
MTSSPTWVAGARSAAANPVAKLAFAGCECAKSILSALESELESPRDRPSDGDARLCLASNQTREDVMAKCDPYHTKEPEDHPVYHNHDDCPDGRRIIQKVDGTDGRPRCEECVKLD